jgi:hypothetical protein
MVVERKGATMPRRIELEALVRAKYDAVRILESGDFAEDECCGMPVSEFGLCAHRPDHPTRANENINMFPEAYSNEGKFLNG